MAKARQQERWKRPKIEWKPGLKLLGHYFVVVVWVCFVLLKEVTTRSR